MTEAPQLTLFYTDKKHMEIVDFMNSIDEFMYTHMNPFTKCITKRLLLDKHKIIPNETNQAHFNRKWNETQKNFDEASRDATCRRDLGYLDKVIMTLFYVLYDIELYDDFEVNEIDHNIFTFSNAISFQHNDMGQIYISLYKQLEHCCILKEGKMIISTEKSKEYFIL
jgi:hypothetical protein